jgi:lipopolysaccharide export system permease protein
VKIYDHTDRLGNIKVTTAQSGYMEMSPNQEYIIFTLFDGYSYTDIVSERNYRDNRPFDRTAFKQQRIRFDLSEFNMNRTKEELFKSHYTMLNIKQLNMSVDSLEQRFEERKKRYKTSFAQRYQNFATLDTTSKAMLAMKKPTEEVVVDTTKSFIDHDSTFHLEWPFIANFDKKEKGNLLEMALTAARSARDNVIFNKNDFNYQQENIRKHLIAWHKKFTLSIACLILFFIGAPMGAIIRKGGLGLPVVISVLFFVIYHITSITGEKAAKVGDLDVVTGVWLSSLVLFPMGLFLTFKATTDAGLLDIDSWRKIFRKLFPAKTKTIA